jgi:hypothetical protein
LDKLTYYRKINLIKEGTIMDYKSKIMNSISWVFGGIFSVIGVVNMVWGNDSEFGVFLFVTSLIYYPPITILLKRYTGYSTPIFIKIGLGIFILWASLGVGELFDKIDLMVQSF